MTITPDKPEIEQPVVTLPIPEISQEFNWKNCWYPVTFLQDLAKDRPHSFSLYDEPFVLFINQDGTLGCLTDRCPHRAAKLSDGQIIDGRIECLYHGWQFATDGKCLHIPQLPTDAKIPSTACLPSFKVVERQGIMWVWFGELKAADEELIPTITELDKAEYICLDYVADMPYDQSYFIENAIDPAHVSISHDRTEINAKRENAQPLEMEIIESSAKGIRGRYRRTRTPNANWSNIDFAAPNSVIYTFDIRGNNFYSGNTVYSIPLGKGRCRILIRKYWQSLTWVEKIKPRWLKHLHQNKILDEDSVFIIGLQAQIEQLAQNLKQVYLPLKTSDTFILEYRKWLDKFGASLPFYRGYSTSKQAENHGDCDQKPMTLDRLTRHTLICSSCNRAYGVINKLKQGLIGVAIAMALLAIVTDGSSQIGTVFASLLAVALAVMTEKLKTKFEHIYTRQ
ncbi:aromatic ring-hydroxylating dioxygenase subunit alpha [Nostoc sp.]|uniref:aromatic ring-hydroxylating dioxygenase subunit alpha n=1 Tax=Nostoc sp. TaxID=1180 RepID=UPI002FF53686